MNRAIETKLVADLLAGDPKALHRIYRKLQPKLMAYLSVKIADKQDAEELLQDIFLSFVEALPLFQFESSLETFLYAIARHEVGDYWRKHYAKKVIRTVPILRSLPKVHTHEQLALKMHSLIEGVYAALTVQQARLLRMKYEDQLSIKEMAVRLGMSTKSVESALFRARSAFKAHYDSYRKKPEWAYLELRAIEEDEW